tara:strand:- start:35 stop:196 length:162 start_codon:yes stop_codon:yes gene_type:complete
MLLKHGIPYEAILSFTDQELNLVLGVQAALDQREVDERDRQDRLADQRRRIQT